MRSALRIAPPAVKRAEGKTPFRCEGRRDMPECLDRRAMARPGSNFSLGRAGGAGGVGGRAEDVLEGSVH